MKIRALLASALLLGAVSNAEAEITKGFYAGANLIGAEHKAKDMEDSIRPNGVFTKEKDKKKFVSGSIDAGYKFDDIFRVELEYVFPKKNEFISSQAGSFAHHKIKSQRLMVNAYASYPINEQFAVYGTAGIGYARLKSTGYQNSNAARFNSGSDNNFAWSLGVGASFKPVNNTYIDLGFRHVNMGKANSGMTNFGGQSEQMKAKVVSNEITLGVRYMLGEWYTEDEHQPVKNIYADHVTPELRESFERTNYSNHSASFRDNLGEKRF